MNLTLSKKGKKMNFEKFVEVFGEHFKVIPLALRDAKMKEIYERETGRSVDTKRKRKKDKQL